MEKGEASCTVGGNVNRYSHYGEEYGDSLKKRKTRNTPTIHPRASLVAQLVKNPPTMRETWVRSLGWEDPLEKGKATHSRILAWRIPRTVQSMGSQRVGCNRATFTFTPQRAHYWA